MWHFNALVNYRKDRIYVGMTEDLTKRIAQHNMGKTKSTKGYGRWELLHQEILPSRLEARLREKYLKSGIGKQFLKTLVP